SSRMVSSVATSPPRMRAGSPGMSRTMANTSMVTTRSAGIPATTRWRTRRQITGPFPRSVLEVRAVQRVQRLERVPVQSLERFPCRPDLRLAVQEERGDVLHQDALHTAERLHPLLDVEGTLLELE